MTTLADAVPTLATGDDYLIWSNAHAAWWGPNSAGYFTTLALAGRYSREEAIAICAHCRDGYTFRRRPTEIPIRAAEAINAPGRSPFDMLRREDRAECRARDKALKARSIEAMHYRRKAKERAK
jgi:hypothetical protein